jgi:hypothetical protein
MRQRLCALVYLFPYVLVSLPTCFLLCLISLCPCFPVYLSPCSFVYLLLPERSSVTI